MTTIRKLITGAMRLDRIIAANEEPTDEDIRVAQQALTGMLDSMQADLLNIYTTTPHRFLLQPGKQEYTLGPALNPDGSLSGADWVLERPVRVEKAVLLQNPTVVYPVAPPPPPIGPGYGFYITATTGPGDAGVYSVEAATAGLYAPITASGSATAATPTLWSTVVTTTPFVLSFPVDIGDWAIASAQAFNALSSDALLTAQGLGVGGIVTIDVAFNDGHTCQLLLPTQLGGQLFYNSQTADGPDHRLLNFTVLDGAGSRAYRVRAPEPGLASPTFTLERLS